MLTVIAVLLLLILLTLWLMDHTLIQQHKFMGEQIRHIQQQLNEFLRQQ